MLKPDFHAQRRCPDDPWEAQKWFFDMAADFRSRGATWIRKANIDNHNGGGRMLTLDAWKVRPDEEGQPFIDMTYERTTG